VGLIDIAGSQTLGGLGTVVFGQNGGNLVRIVQAGTTLTLGLGITVRGQNGTLGSDSTTPPGAN